jgi:predicted small integral membrane protein
LNRPAVSTHDSTAVVGSGAGRRFGSLSVACTIITALEALYMLLVGFGNVTDYGTNFAFVRHVMAMDATNFGAAPGTKLDAAVMWRAVTSPAIQTAVYLCIIAWELLSALVLVYATLLWLFALRTGRFDAPRRWSAAGFLMLVVLFMGGFIDIGGEWFQMWRSDVWNGLEAAFHNAVLALFGLVLIHLPSREWASATAVHAAKAPERPIETGRLGEERGLPT